MNLHEYQAKQLLKEAGLPIPKGATAQTVEQALTIADSINGASRWVVKAQVHAGGRGKAGGVRLANSKEELVEIARNLLHSRLVTYQTNESGQPIHELLIEETCDIKKELYLGAVIDRSSQRLMFMASEEGGVDIEQVAQKSPEKIVKISVDPLLGMMPYQCRLMAYALSLFQMQMHIPHGRRGRSCSPDIA